MKDASIPLEYLVGFAEIAETLREGRTTVGNWYDRRARNGFPECVKRLRQGPLFDLREVKEWYDDYTPSKGGRPAVLRD
jgi:hypothetical protein